MTGTPKTFASLSSTLLARKGQARPAMRPQGLGHASDPNDALGWNDTGAPAPAPKPVVLRQREVLDAQIAASPAEFAAKKAPSAFTLRLDADRHLRLRLASAVTNQSAQQLVTRALDALLDSLPEVEALARQTASAADRG